MSGSPSSQLFLSFLSTAAPTANYRGESEQNRAMLQKIAIDDHEYPVVSPEAIRSALREMLRAYGLPCNRRRETNEPQLAVSYESYPNPDEYVDDFYFGYMVVNREQIPKALAKTFQYKRESILRSNLYLDRTMQWTADNEAAIRALTVEQVNAAIKRHIKPDTLSVFVAGDFAGAARKAGGTK